MRNTKRSEIAANERVERKRKGWVGLGILERSEKRSIDKGGSCGMAEIQSCAFSSNYLLASRIKEARR